MRGATTGVPGTATDSSPRAGSQTATPGGIAPAGTKTAGLSAVTSSKAPAPARPVRSGPPSKCPARPSEFDILVDPVVPQKPGTTLPVSFDVCGLPAGTMFVTDIKFRTIKRFNNSTPIAKQFPDEAETNRERRRKFIDLTPLDPGRYSLDIIVTDRDGRNRGRTIEIRVLDR